MCDIQESYSAPGFAEFYDLMVQGLPPEYEAGADVDRVCWPLLQAVAVAGARGPAHAVTALDLCCGSGRVALGLAARWAAWGQRPANLSLDLVGADRSDEMLAAAAAKAQAQQAAYSDSSSGGSNGGGSSRVRMSWHRADAEALGAAPELAALRGRCSLVTVSAGSFHHLLTAADQVACLRGLAACLCPGPGPAYAVVNLLDAAHLCATPGEAAVVGPFLRTCLSQEREAGPDGGSGGGAVWRQRFSLERYASEAAAQAAATAAAGGCGAAQPAERPLWRQEEGWALREVAPSEFQQLAEAAGLEVVQRQARWADGWDGGGAAAMAAACPPERARIFVLRRAS